jgi:hypothetical protein
MIPNTTLQSHADSRPIHNPSTESPDSPPRVLHFISTTLSSTSKEGTHLSLPSYRLCTLRTMRAMRRRRRNTLRIRTGTSLDDIPSLGVADAHGLAGKTLFVAVVALEGVLSAGSVGEGRSDEEAEEADSEELEVHGEVDGLSSRVGLVVGCC